MFSARKDKRATLAPDDGSGLVSFQGIHFDSISKTSSDFFFGDTPMRPNAENSRSFYLEILQHYSEIAVVDTVLAPADEAAEDVRDYMWRTLFLDIITDLRP